MASFACSPNSSIRAIGADGSVTCEADTDTVNTSADNITSGTLNVARYDAYDDLSSSGRLDNNSTTDLLTRSQADSRYFNASNLSSGTLSTSRYDAYSDLSTSGRLNNNSSSDLLT